MTATHLLAALAVLIAAPLTLCGYWLYLDAKDKAQMRRDEARYWDEMGRIHRAHQHDRHDHADPNRPE